MSSRIDKAYAAYFVIHIAITMLVDAAIALPAKYQLPIQRKLLATHMMMNNDVIVAARPPWLVGFVWIELLLQLPFFFYGAYALLKNDKRVYPFALAYGVEASTTTFGCLVEVLAVRNISSADRFGLLGLYLPTFIIPAVLALDFGSRIYRELSPRKLKAE